MVSGEARSRKDLQGARRPAGDRGGGRRVPRAEAVAGGGRRPAAALQVPAVAGGAERADLPVADCRGPGAVEGGRGGAPRRGGRTADGAGGSMLGGWSLAFALRWLEEEEDPARGIGPEDAAHQSRWLTRPTLAQSPSISSLADAVVLFAEGAAVPPLALT